MAVAAWALARFSVRTTGSVVGGAAGAALLMLNPNLLYLQSTPMTEPLLLATCLLAIALTAEWVDADGTAGTRAAGWAIVAACMTRYEAWPVCGALIALAWLALLRRGQPLGASLRRTIRLATYPAIALVLFSANSRWTTGTWFVPAGFFVPENEALGNATLAFAQVRESVVETVGRCVVVARICGVTARRSGGGAPARPCAAAARARARGGRGAAVVRVLPGTSAAHPLWPAARRRVCGADRQPGLACCGVHCAFPPPRPSSSGR